MKYPQKYRRQGNSTTFCSDSAPSYINRGTKKFDFGIAKNYRGITLTSISAKIFSTQLRNCIEPKIEKIFRKNQNGSRRNRSTTSQILTICRILEGECAKYLEATLLFPQRDLCSHNDAI